MSGFDARWNPLRSGDRVEYSAKWLERWPGQRRGEVGIAVRGWPNLWNVKWDGEAGWSQVSGWWLVVLQTNAPQPADSHTHTSL